MLGSIIECELGGDLHPLFFFRLDLDVNDKLFIEVTRIKPRMVRNNVVHSVVFPDGFLTVWTVDWDICTGRGGCGLFG